MLCASKLKAFSASKGKVMVSEKDGCWKMHSCCSEAGSQVTQLPQAAPGGSRPKEDAAGGCVLWTWHRAAVHMGPVVGLPPWSDRLAESLDPRMQKAKESGGVFLIWYSVSRKRKLFCGLQL